MNGVRIGGYGHDIEFGVFITPAAESADEVVAWSELSEEAGYDLVTFNDHPYSAARLDAWTLMSFVAARTARVRLSANVLSLPLRPPAVVARAAASLDVLSHGRFELGLGAGMAWDAIETMGGRRLSPGESVEALEEGIHVIRELWNTGASGDARFEGQHYRLAGAARGPAPVHNIGIWVGAFKPRMLRLVGRLADGWLPTIAGLKPGDLTAGNAVIDAAALEAGREPRAIRRLLNVGRVDASARDTASEFTRLALEDGIGTFIVTVTDPRAIVDFAAEVAPRVREAVTQARQRGPGDSVGGPSRTAVGVGAPPELAAVGVETEIDGLGVTPTPDSTTRHSDRAPWDESNRPRHDRLGSAVSYSDAGRRVSQTLVGIHDMLRQELSELRDILRQVRDGAMHAADARGALNEMALRQNDWTLGTICSRYCGVVAAHHSGEDSVLFPHLARREPQLKPVIDRLTDEHLVIHEAIEKVDHALVQHMTRPEGHDAIQDAIDFLTDALLSHLAYEEQELVEPLARLGFYPGQVPDGAAAAM
jgi:alkanesulfonate monooxygenase SsuD/methylene tetrahydromethanopterin reductase-like flavin-dependent oxidoreductase (luciferase family)/iron-sulfur cluster repair protein YtfE (RIC family)